MRIKSNVFRMYEMRDTISRAIENGEKVIAEQEELLEILSLADRKAISDATIEGIKHHTEQLKKKVAQYKFDLEIVKDVIARYETYKDNEEFNEIDIIITEMLHLLTDLKIEEDNEEPAPKVVPLEKAA